MSDNNRDDLILQYLDGALAPEQQAVVEARLLTDPEWKDAFDRLNTAAAAIRYYGIRQEVAAVQESYFTQASRTHRKSGLLRTLRVTTAVAATILFFFIAYQGYEFYTLSGDKVYSRIYVAYTVPLTRDTDTVRSGIETAFAQKDFATVDSLADAAKKPGPRETFLAGIASLELKDYPAAISRLQQSVSPNHPNQQDATYYLAIAYLQNRDYDLAIDLMEKIREDPRHPYNSQFSGTDIRDLRMLKWK